MIPRLLGLALVAVAVSACLSPPGTNGSEPASDDQWRMLRGGPTHMGSRGHLTEGAGREVWNFTTTNETIFDLSLEGETLYASAGEDHLYALHLGTGSVRWEYRFPRGISGELAVADGLVLGASSDLLYALDLKTRALRWTFDEEDGNWSGRVGRPPVIADGKVLFGTGRGIFYALDADSGGVIWQTTLSNHTEPNQPPVLVGGYLYFGSSGATLYKVDAETGSLEWKHDLGGLGDVLSPAVWESTVYFVEPSRFENVFALDDATGRLKWKYRVYSNAPHAPVVADGLVFIYGWDNRVHAVDAATGERRWMFTTGDAKSCHGLAFCQRDDPAPAYLDGVLFVPGLDHQLYALDGQTGSVLWQAPLAGASRTSPIVVDNRIYVGVDNTLHAIEWGGKPPH